MLTVGGFCGGAWFITMTPFVLHAFLVVVATILIIFVITVATVLQMALAYSMSEFCRFRPRGSNRQRFLGARKLKESIPPTPSDQPCRSGYKPGNGASFLMLAPAPQVPK